MQEREILRRIAGGDEAALETLYRSYHPRLIRFLGRFSGNAAIVEEAINDTMFVVWQSAERFRGDSSPSTWILGIAYRKVLQALRREKPKELPLELNGSNPDIVHDIAAAVRRLPVNHAAVVVLTYEFGYSYREISQILDCPENTVKTRMFNARRKLKSMLEV
jgi:RNA polymerase sigma-70 factor (ECF subfamily)